MECVESVNVCECVCVCARVCGPLSVAKSETTEASNQTT